MKFTPLIATATITFCTIQAAPVKPLTSGFRDFAQMIEDLKKGDIQNALDDLEKLASTFPIPIPSLQSVHTRSDPPINDEGDDPEFTARVRLDEEINEIYRQARVAEIKQSNPEMRLRPVELDMIVHELQMFGVSVGEQEFCDRIKHHVDEFELQVTTDDLAKMCKQKHQELKKALQDEDRAFAEAEKIADRLNADGMKHVLHWIQQQKEHDEHHKSFGEMERERWIDKQLQRAKHNEAVKAGLKGGKITRRAERTPVSRLNFNFTSKGAEETSGMKVHHPQHGLDALDGKGEPVIEPKQNAHSAKDTLKNLTGLPVKWKDLKWQHWW